jgi:predicted TIM-barrel fold metal-dependent hydrolase
MPFHGRIRQAVRGIGPDRVLFGSDALMVHPGPEILRIRVAGLTPAEERLVLRENMLRLITP